MFLTSMLQIENSKTSIEPINQGAHGDLFSTART